MIYSEQITHLLLHVTFSHFSKIPKRWEVNLFIIITSFCYVWRINQTTLKLLVIYRFPIGWLFALDRGLCIFFLVFLHAWSTRRKNFSPCWDFERIINSCIVIRKIQQVKEKRGNAREKHFHDIFTFEMSVYWIDILQTCL